MVEEALFVRVVFRRTGFEEALGRGAAPGGGRLQMWVQGAPLKVCEGHGVRAQAGVVEPQGRQGQWVLGAGQATAVRLCQATSRRGGPQLLKYLWGSGLVSEAGQSLHCENSGKRTKMMPLGGMVASHLSPTQSLLYQGV